MAWPTTPTGTLTSGVAAQGITTVRWGTKDAVTAINGTTFASSNVAVVTRINERALAENIKLPNGDGVTVTRVQVVDGVQWDVTIRDNSGATTAGVTGRPTIGSSVTITDMAGLIGTVALKYAAIVVESAYEAAPKQPGELTFTVENLVLVESQSGT